MRSLTRAVIVTTLIAGSLVGSSVSAMGATPSSDEVSPAAEAPPAEETAAVGTESQAVSDATAADAVEEAVATGEDVVVDDLVTPTSQIVASPDGTLTYEVSSVPVRTKQDGEWVGIDTDLVLRDGWWEPKASAAPVRFSNGLTDELSQVSTPSGDWVTETWPHGNPPTPVIDGPTATYAEILPGVDLKLTATELGMASVYVIKTPAAATNDVLAELHVDLGGADVTKAEEGNFEAETPSGDTITATSPLWWDSSDGGTYVEPGEENPAMPVAHEFSEDGVTMDVPETVEKKAPTYPIYVDPDWAAGPWAAWYTDAAFPDQSYLSAGQSDILRVGRYAPYRSNMFFQFVITPLAGKQILGAQLATTQLNWASCPNSPIQVRLYALQEAGFTWNQQNHNGWGPVLDTKNPGSCSSGPEAVGWNVTAGVQQMVGGRDIQFGFAPQDESAWSRRHFSRAATLYVSYNSPPNVPTDPKFVSPNAACGTEASPTFISASSVTVSVNQTDPDAGNVDTNFSLYKASDLGSRVQWQYPGLGAQGTKTVTFNSLVDGQAYAWNARGSDWVIDGIGSTAWCYFTIDRTGPSAPAIGFPSGQRKVGEPVTATFTTNVAEKVKFIAYTVAAPANANSFVFDIFTSPPQCNSSIGLVRIVCPNASGVATATFAPIETTSTLLAIAYDVAGNPAVVAGTPTGQVGRVGSKYSFTAAVSPSASFAAGHVWLTQNKPSPLASQLADTNATNPSPLNLGVATARRVTANPIAPSVPISKSVLGFWYLKPYSPGSGQPNIYLSENPIDAGSQAIYKCSSVSGTVAGSGTSADCDSAIPGGTKTIQGYTWSVGQGSVPLISCSSPGNVQKPVYVWPGSTCRNAGDEWLQDLGFVAPGNRTGPPITTSSAPVVVVGSSFTAAAWLKPGTGGTSAALSTNSSTGGFELGATATQWRFCTKVASPASTICATAPRSATADWTHVAGVWDAANGQLRLYLNASLAATSSFTWPSAPTASAALNVGAEQGSSVVNWSGLLADPATFGGVLTSSQIGALRSGQDPANG